MTDAVASGLAYEAAAAVLPEVAHPYWTLERVHRALRTGPRTAHPLAGVSTDTRSLRRGDLFVALSGDNFDAHDFLAQARDAGAAAFVVSDPVRAAGIGLPTYVVADTLVALGDLANAWRTAWGRTVVAVAGSNGKTSTKELVRAALSPTLDTHATKGNLNNLVGVPLTLLALPATAEIAVVELGTNAPGEVARLRAISRPDVAVLTSIGEEHLEGLGDLAGVLREECDVFVGADVAIVPAAHPETFDFARRAARSVIVAGLDSGDMVPSAWGLDTEGRPWIELDGTRVELPLRGAHQASNAMLALAVARVCGVPIEAAAAGIARMPVPTMRGVWEPVGKAILYNDAYNANPPSMRAALDLLSHVGSGRQRVAVLGTMRELGTHADAAHADIARKALASPIDLIAGVGEFAAPLARIAAEQGTPDRVVTADELDVLWSKLAPRLAPDAVILLKASRGMRLERLVSPLTAWAAA